MAIAKKVNEYSSKNPDKKIIRLGIGDVTKPIVPAVINAMHKVVDEMGNRESFRGKVFLMDLLLGNSLINY